MLLAAIVARAQEATAALSGGEEPVWLRTIIPGVNGRDLAAAARAGFAPIKQYYRMQIDLLDPPAAALPRAGVTIRTMQPGRDDCAVYDVVDAAFRALGRPERAFDEWHSYMLRADHFEPTLWYLAETQGRLVGVALCYDYDSYGWVRQLAVLPAFQGRAIGSALLRHAFHAFYESTA